MFNGNGSDHKIVTANFKLSFIAHQNRHQVADANSTPTNLNSQIAKVIRYTDKSWAKANKTKRMTLNAVDIIRYAQNR